MIHAHILTYHPQLYFTRQAPGGRAQWEDVAFTFGLTIPTAAEVLIVYTFRLGLRTHLPRARCGFVAGEPDFLGYYPDNFLNQFGAVVLSGTRQPPTRRLPGNMAHPWHIGIDHADPDHVIAYDEIATWDIPAKDNRISIVTSNLASLPYHRTRLALIAALEERIPERIVRYGRGVRFIADKAEGLLPHKYHLVLENNDEPWGWTEKLADPLLAHCFPFYVGCANLEEQFPAGSFLRLDPADPAGAIRAMVAAVEDDLWTQSLPVLRRARDRILGEYNILAVFARMARTLAAQPVAGDPITLRSRRGVRPARTSGVRDWLKFLGTRTLLAMDPDWERRRFVRRPARGMLCHADVKCVVLGHLGSRVLMKLTLRCAATAPEDEIPPDLTMLRSLSIPGRKRRLLVLVRTHD